MRDLRYAVRVLWKSPVFAVTAILTLALCVGANTAIYTVVDRVLLRPLPYPEPDRLAEVMTHFDRGGEDGDGQTGSTWEALRDGVASMDLAALTGGFASTGVNLVVDGRPEYVKQQRVSAGFFRVLGVAPALGREFTNAEDVPNGPAVAVLSQGLWRRLFNGNASAVGKSITLLGEPYTVVGVMPASFTTNSAVDVWTPARPWRRGEGGGQNYEIVGRLKPGVTWAEADAQVRAAADPILKDIYKAPATAHETIVSLQQGETTETRQPLMLLWSAVGVVLLIGCVNIAGLLLARARTRAPEIATRIAIGGGRAVIIRQLLVESVVLAAAGGIAGLAIGYAGAQLFATLLEDAFGVTGQIGLDARVLAISGGAALLTSVVFGLLPAIQASRVDLRQTLVEGGSPSIAGTARSWPRRAMVVVEVALGVVLLVGAGLLVRTFDHLLRLSPGFDGTRVMTATLSLQDARYQTASKVNQLFDQSLARLRNAPGVHAAAVCLTLPYERALNTGGRWVGAKPGSEQIDIFNETYVTPQYFDALRIPVMRGRVFTDADSAAGAPVMVVNVAFVKRYSRDEDPIGRQIVGGGGAPPRTIVGVVGDIQQKAGWGSFGPMAAMAAAYVPAAQTSDAFLKMVHSWFSPSWFVRLAGPQEGAAAEMQRAVQSVDPLLPFAKFRTLDDVRGETLATQSAQTTLLGTLAALALVLAAVGLYGLVANSVAERTRELGIRMALGATASRASVAAAAPGITLALVGIAIGLAAARAAATTLRHFLWGVTVGDPLTFAGAAAVVFAVAAIAAIVPALRIVRLNPIKALRNT
ncbi:MAG TPA: ADOP family duplicated permease [Vicinamibacterales bacterium]|nr:ADOP family duplicated permease [Vicinamibacterales bacterium]